MHVIKYKWDKFEPFLVVNPGMEKIGLFNNEMNMFIGEKRCTGSFTGSRYVECNQKIEFGNQCNSCVLKDRFAMCFRCTGAECINEKRRSDCKDEQYFIYLAAFHSILKVGISIEMRFLERLVEQGADFGAIVGRVKDGLAVRKIEQEMARALGITDRVRGEEKARMLFCNPNIAIENITTAIKNLRTGFSQYLIPPQIFDLRSYYMLHKVPVNPRKLLICEKAELKGNVVAAKGNIVVLENDGFSAFNAHELLGREIVAQ